MPRDPLPELEKWIEDARKRGLAHPAAAAFVTALFSFAFAARAFVVELDLVAFADAEADSLTEAVLLPLACCMLLLLAAKLAVARVATFYLRRCFVGR